MNFTQTYSCSMTFSGAENRLTRWLLVGTFWGWNEIENNYRIQSNYRTYPYKRTVKKFRSLQITASVIFLYIFLKAYVVGTHLNCIDLSMQFKWVPTTYAFIKKIRNNHIIIIK